MGIKLTLLIITIWFSHFPKYFNYNLNISFSFNIQGDIPIITLYFPERMSPLLLPLNTAIPFTYLTHQDYINFVNPEPDIPFNNNNITLLHKEYEYIIKSPQLYSSTSTLVLPSYSFYVLKMNTTSSYMKGVSLSPLYDNISFISQLKSNNLINEMQFTFDIHNQQIHFGKVDIKHKKSFRLHIDNSNNNNSNLWGNNILKISSSIYRDKYIDLNKYVYFNTASMNMFDSCEFYLYLVKKVLKDAIDNNECSYYENISYQDVITCKYEILERYGNIEFEFDEGVISVPLVKFFNRGSTNTKKVVNSKFYCDTYVNSVYDHKVFGFNFLAMFDYAKFDLDNKVIHLYSDDNAVEFKQYNNNKEMKYVYIKIIFSMIILMNFIWVLMLIYIKLTHNIII